VFLTRNNRRRDARDRNAAAAVVRKTSVYRRGKRTKRNYNEITAIGFNARRDRYRRRRLRMAGASETGEMKTEKPRTTRRGEKRRSRL